MSEPEIDHIPVPENEHPQVQLSSTSAGARLAAYRKERGWTVEQVASQLNLAVRQIIALEHDDYPSLPGMPIVRGFIRSYAKLLKIDPAPLLALVGGETVMVHEPLEPHKSLAAPFSETRLPSMADRPGLSSKWVVGGLLIVLLGVGIWAAQQSPDVNSLQKTASDQVKDGIAYLSGSEAGKPAEEKLAASAQPEAQQTANLTSAAPGAVAEALKEEAGKPAAEFVQPADQAKPAADIVKTPVQASAATVIPKTTSDAPVKPASTKDALVFNVREDSWIEVRRVGDKSILLSRIVKAGTSESVEVGEPVSVVVGNAAGVDANLRGEPVDMKSGGGNVARLSLK